VVSTAGLDGHDWVICYSMDPESTLRLTMRASAAAGVWAARDAPLPLGLKGTIAGRRDADDVVLIPLPSLSSVDDPPAPDLLGDKPADRFAY